MQQNLKKKVKFHFNSDAFAAITVVIAKAPDCPTRGNPNKNNRGVCHTLFLLVKIRYMYLYQQGC